MTQRTKSATKISKTLLRGTLWVVTGSLTCPPETLSGWAFLVVLMSVFFAITCLNLYVMSIYLSNIYSEIKNRPLYIIESVRRF